jgi:predicted anti-sigma-YlaC factor YlaD
MNCDYALQEISLVLKQDVQPSKDFQAHIVTCSKCRRDWQQQALELWMSTFLDVPIEVIAPLTKTLWLDYSAH